MKDAFIVEALRTPRARRKGKFTSVHPVDLATYPLNALKARLKFDPAQIEDVIMGCVTQTGEQGWCVARSSVLAAGWPITVPATTVNRLCGSGQQATNFGAQGVQSGQYELVVTGGLEHMTRCAMFSDCGGEESPMVKAIYPDLVPQGLSAEILSAEFKLSRKQLDEFACASQLKAAKAQKEGKFKSSIVPVKFRSENGAEEILDFDDNVRGDSSVEKLSTLKTVFKEDGVITAGNASAIVDGAAAILLANEKKLKELKAAPRARIVSMASIGSPPKIMLTGPIEASRIALKRANLKVSDIDLWEINEAFAPVPLVTIQELAIDPAKVNVNGGGISLGHPLGATGAMLIGMAVDELHASKKRYALITMCIGLGMGIATVIERV